MISGLIVSTVKEMLRSSESASAVEDLQRAWANFDRLVAELGIQWPEGINAVDAVRDVRREL